jgi:anti-sigma B factor antagonist
MNFDFSIELKNNIFVISLKGELIEKNQASGLIELLEQKISAGENNIILNLEDLKYMNSTGLNVLINILTKCRNSGGEAILSSLSSKVKQLFLVTRLNSVFTVVETTEDAFTYFNESK